METRPLGDTDQRVSVFGLGCMTFGGQTDEVDAMRQLDRAFDAGITLYDTAENYPTPLAAATQGRSEEILGRWIRRRGVRAQVVVATKVAGPGQAAGDLRHIRGESRRLDATNINAAVEGSLRRLGTDCIDLYQVHWAERAVTTLGRSRYSRLPDAPGQVPIEDTLDALAAQVRAGRIRRFGVCNESAWGAMRYLAAARERNLPRIVSIQNAYSLLDRHFEQGLAEVAVRERAGLLAHSPLAGGTLTGKYGGRPAALAGSRSSQSAAFLARLSEARLRAIDAYVALAQAHGVPPAHLALAFVRQQPFTTSVLLAASSVTQLQANLGVVDVVLPREVVQAVNAIHDRHPNPA